MKGGMSTTILAALALLLAGLCLADADDVSSTIRLPMYGAEGDVSAAEAAEGLGQKRPWDCCDREVCRPQKRLPPFCECLDIVESCSDDCKKCWPRLAPTHPDGYSCFDLYTYNVGEKRAPKCNRPAGN